MKKPIIVISTFIILSFFFPSPSFAVCRLPGYDPEGDPDINLDLSGWEEIGGLLDQFVFLHETDPNAPQLSTLIGGICDLAVNSVNMISGTDRPPAPDIPADYANLVCLSTPVGAPVLVPNSGYDMGGGCEAVVLYATPNSIVLNYTPDDDIAGPGYTVYLNNFQVDPYLLAYYNDQHGAGRTEMPCLSGGERIGVSSGETCVAIRDSGTFMDPRWEEWWNPNQCPTSALDLILKLINLCTGELPSPGLCPAPFPQPDKCCPIKSPDGPDWIRTVAERVSGSLLGFVEWLLATAGVDIDFTLYTSIPDLARSWQLQYDADYFWASNPRYDPRRIALPDEEPEEGMWPGAALRVAPPDYRPSWMWKENRDRELKWVIPLDQYGVGNWHGRSEAFHPLATASVDLWEWLIKTPATEELVAAHSSPLASVSQPNLEQAMTSSASSKETNGNLGTNNTTQPTKLTFSGDNSSSSQILGTQLAAADEEYCTSVSVSCFIVNREATCSVYGNCSNNCGHNHIETEPKDVYGTRCDHAGPGCLPEPGAGGPCHYTIPPDQNTFSVTFINRGDHDGCFARATCETTLGANGNGSCSADSGDVCGTATPTEAEVCHPPWVEVPEDVCSDLTERRLTTAEFITLMFDQYLGGGVELFPFFPRIEEIAYRLAGVLTERYKNYREAGIGGVFDAFLPPGTTPPEQQKFPTLDANAEFSPMLKIDITWGCPPFYNLVYGDCDYRCCSETGCRDVGGCHECVAGEECRESCDSQCCFDWLPYGSTCLACCISSGWHPDPMPLETGKGFDLIDDVGSQTEALRQTQQWLAPPQ